MIPAAAVVCLVAIVAPRAAAFAASGNFAPPAYTGSLDPNMIWELLIGGIVGASFLGAISLWVLSAVRKAVGDGYEIMTDCNQGFSVDEAIRRAERLREIDPAWIEEPLPADDIDGHVRLSNSTATPVAIGESLYSIRHFREYMQKGGCNIVQVDVGRIGGITPWLKVAHMAEAFDMPVCPHFLMELHVSLACAVPNGKYVEYIPQLDELTGKKMVIENGHALAPSEPGLGIDWDLDALEARSIAEFNVTVTERRD